MAVILLVFKDRIAGILSNDPNTRQIILDTMIPYVIFLAINNILQILWGICKGIGIEKLFFLGNVFGLTVLYFSSYFILYWLGFDYMSYWYSRIAQLVSSIVFGIIILLKTDWNLMADTITKSLN